MHAVVFNTKRFRRDVDWARTISAMIDIAIKSADGYHCGCIEIKKPRRFLKEDNWNDTQAVFELLVLDQRNNRRSFVLETNIEERWSLYYLTEDKTEEDVMPCVTTVKIPNHATFLHLKVFSANSNNNRQRYALLKAYDVKELIENRFCKSSRYCTCCISWESSYDGQLSSYVG